MRPLSLAIVLCALGACFGAVIANRGGDDSSATTTTPSSQDPLGPNDRPRSLPAIDKQKRIAMPAVEAPADVGTIAMRHAEALVSFGPRHSVHEVGMPGWTKQLGYIERNLQQLGLEVARDTWTDRRELITFTNLSATIPGRRNERILLACHHDTKCTTGHDNDHHNFDFVGANDGASAVGLLLALAPVLLEQPREATIELVFFDGEESLDWNWNDAKRALFGSKRYLRRYVDARALGGTSRIEAMILLDMVGRKDLHIQDELYSTTRLREIVWSAALATATTIASSSDQKARGMITPRSSIRGFRRST